MTTILLVEGEAASADLVRRGLTAEGITVEVCSRAGDALALIAARDFACVVTELTTPELRGVELVDRLASEKPGLPVIILTPREQIASAVAAHRASAYDVCGKPIDLSQLVLSIRRAAERRALQAEISRLQRIVSQMGPGPDEPGGLTLEQVERRHILRIITTHRGNKAAAAAVLGVDRKTLYRKLLRYGSDS